MLAYHAFNIVQERRSSSRGSEAPTASEDGQSAAAADGAIIVKREIKKEDETRIHHSHLEKVMKQKRTHRAMRDSDTRFLDEVLDVMEDGIPPEL